MRKNPPDEVRRQAFIRDEWKCLACGKRVYSGKSKRRKGRPLAIADHIIPRSKGGSDNLNNLQTLCRECDSAKGAEIIDYRC